MVAVKIPMNDLELSPDAAQYVAILERQVVGLTILELKYRTVLELVTGENWEDMKIDLEEGAIKKLAVGLIEKKLKVGNMEARKIVEQRIAAQAEKTPLPTGQFS